MCAKEETRIERVNENLRKRCLIGKKTHNKKRKLEHMLSRITKTYKPRKLQLTWVPKYWSHSA